MHSFFLTLSLFQVPVRCSTKLITQAEGFLYRTAVNFRKVYHHYHNYRSPIEISLYIRGTQRIVSVNYVIGRPFIPYDFLKGIFTSNFRDMENSSSSVFGLTKMSFRVPKKGQLRVFGKEIRPKVFGKWTNMP